MDEIDKKLLNLVQEGLPLESRPFLTLAKQIGIAEEEVIQRVNELKENGYIRRLGGIFDSKKLGYASTLCAINVPEQDIENIAKIINSYDEITHNYIRNHEYNMWFTIIASSETRVKEIIDSVKDKTEINSIITLPVIKLFKIKVALDMMRR